MLKAIMLSSPQMDESAIGSFRVRVPRLGADAVVTVFRRGESFVAEIATEPLPDLTASLPRTGILIEGAPPALPARASLLARRPVSAANAFM
ncbi:MAG: hypothetical protein EOR22_25355 [Mesorhizobium sp.]|nr:MAG: hypothetical protein EOR22_25355 [Mesorhizobium sp.]